MFSLLGSILRSFLRKTSSQTSKSLSFPKASIGNPDEIVTLRSTQGHGEYNRIMTGPPIKTFGGDHPEINEKTGIMEWWNHGLCRSSPRPSVPSFHYSNVPVFGFRLLGAEPAVLGQVDGHAVWT